MPQAISDNGEPMELINGQWQVVGGRFVPSPGVMEGVQQSITEGVPDFVSSVGVGFKNFMENLQLLEETPERNAREALMQARSPVASALGEVVPAAALAIPGAAGGTALAGVMGMRALGTFLASSIGSGITGQFGMQSDDVSGDLASGLALDAVQATAMGIGGRGPSIANRVVQAIRKGGKFKRDVQAGDIPGVGESLANRIQDSGLPLTTGQASGNQADLMLEGSLRRNPFAVGPGFAAIDEAQQLGINTAAAKAIGLPEGTQFLDPPTMTLAKKNIGENITAAVEAVGPMEIDANDIVQLRRLSEAPFVKSTSGKQGLAKIAQELEVKLNDGELLTPQDFLDIRQQLNAEIGVAEGANVRILGDALDIVDGMPGGALESRGIDVQQFNEAYSSYREQWRTMLQLEKGATITGDGNVNVGQLNRNLQNSFGNVVETPSVTPATQNLRELSEAFSAKRMQKGPTSGTAENLQASEQIANAAEIVGQIGSGDITGGAARGIFTGGMNSLASPLHLGPPTGDVLEQVLRAFGNTGSAALTQEQLGR